MCRRFTCYSSENGRRTTELFEPHSHTNTNARDGILKKKNHKNKNKNIRILYFKLYPMCGWREKHNTTNGKNISPCSTKRINTSICMHTHKRTHNKSIHGRSSFDCAYTYKTRTYKTCTNLYQRNVHSDNT